MKAYETQLEFSGAKGHAVVVEFDKPWRLVFWSKAQYVGCWDVGQGVWFTPEWLETNSPEDFHCYEPIMDKELRYSWVNILESGPARATVRWHYACCNMRYEIFNGDTFADEYYVVYPSGIAVRKLVAWPGDATSFGGNPNFWQVLEYILVNEKGTKPDEVINQQEAFSFQNSKGDVISLPWPLPKDSPNPLCASYPEIADWDMYIGRVHLKDRPDPFAIVVKDQRIFPYRPCTHCKGDHPFFGLFRGDANTFKHWPATDMEDFVLAADAGDEVGKVATHTSFIDCNYTSIPADRPPRATSWLFLTGATEESSSFLVNLAKSWYNPAEIETGYENKGKIPGMAQGKVLYEGYAYSQMAYCFRKFGEDKLEFNMRPNVSVINPVFVVKNWQSPFAIVSMNGEKLGRDQFKTQINGNDCIIWIDKIIDKPTDVVIEGE